MTQITQILKGKPETWTFNFGTDISTYVAIFMLKKNKSDSDADALHTETITSHVDAENGITQFVQTSEEIEQLENGVYWFAIKLFFIDGGAVFESASERVEYEQNIVRQLNIG